MRILHLTDTHIGTHLNVRGGRPGWSRSHDHLHAFQLALEPAMRGEVDLVVHTGDLFNRSRPPPSAMAETARLLLRVAARVPTVLMPGNHDRWGLKRSLPWRAPGLRVVDEPERVVVAGVALGVVPFRRRADSWARAASAAVGKGVDLVLAHQAFHGARVPGLVFREGEQADTIGERHLPAGVRHILCGHIHPRQITQVGGATVVQPGSTARTSFGEGNAPKGYAIWELESEVSWSFQELPERPWVVVQNEAHLSAVVPGALVRVRDPDLEEEVERVGGWVVGGGMYRPARREPERQIGLFGGTRMRAAG